jgi:DNA-binding HxlR family transcriptional regulator
MKDRTELTAEGIKIEIKEKKEIDIIALVLNKKWYKILLLSLDKGNKCYSALRDGTTIDGKKITTGVLNEAIKVFTQEGLVTQVDSATSSDQKDYTLTEHGKTVIPVILGENAWAATHADFMNP